jgi:hypothetical protein
MAAASEYGNSLFGELLQSGLTITAGKYDYLDVLYLARHVLHGELHMPLWHEMAGSERYRADTDTLCRRLAEEIGPTGTLEEREQLVHDAFHRFVRPLQRRRPPTLTKALLAVAVLPRAVRAAVFGGKLRDAARSPARFLRACWVERQDARYGEWALHRLLDPRSPHHDAFAPIYECFQRWPAGIPPESVTASNRTGASGGSANPRIE